MSLISTLPATALLAAVMTFAPVAPAAAESFTFRGQLDDGPDKAEGDYALRLTLYSHKASTVPLAGPLELLDVAMNEGQFAVGVDFGTLPVHLSEGWLEVALKAQGEAGDYMLLGGRNRVDLKASQVCPASWALDGNALTNPALNFLGTTDAQALELRSNNQRVMQLESVFLSQGAYTANVLLGSPANLIVAGVRGATISGGGTASGEGDPDFSIDAPNSVTDIYGTVGGGFANRAGDDAGTTSDHYGATVGGGLANAATGSTSTVAGGFKNTAAGFASSVTGGEDNIANGPSSAVVGGKGNVANATNSTVGGGLDNTAMGKHSTVAMGYENCAGGTYSWVGGYRAKVRVPLGTPVDTLGEGCDNVTVTSGADGDQGTFIWSDAQTAPFESTGPNQFNIRASGGVRLNDDTSQFFGATTRQMLNLWGTGYGIGVQGNTLYFRSNTQFAWFTDGIHSNTANEPGAGGTVRMRLDAAGTLHATGFNPSSDRHAKTAFEAIDPIDILARVVDLPLSAWRFKSSAGQRHIGPMAQDFHAAFGLNGSDNTHIATVDADGVALAAIQGLNAKLEAEVAALRTELDGLRAQVAATRATLER